MPTLDELDAAYNPDGRQSEEWLEMVTRAWPQLREVIGAAQEWEAADEIFSADAVNRLERAVHAIR